MTIHDLNRILVASAGECEGGPLTDDHADVAFDDLGYDSLARLETAARISGEFGVRIPDDVIVELRTPREVVELVNTSLAH